MFETSYSDSYGVTQVASVHHEYGRLTLATAGLLYTFRLLVFICELVDQWSLCGSGCSVIVTGFID